MTKPTAFRGTFLFALGIFAGLFLSNLRPAFVSRAAANAQDGTKKSAPDLAAMQADIAHLKEVVPSQSHTMTDVGYQFANLWFAGKQKNWPLAEFFLNEARQHIVWTIHIRPIRRDNNGGAVDLPSIFEGVSNGPLKDLTQAIAAKDETQFQTTYKQMLDACFACHQASGKPYLRPIIPQAPPQTIISFDPESKGSK